ncbi:MAG: nickel-responsive transcriptional regulator NikR [Candidatus Zixiibacteriota bacterium]
MNKNLHRFGVSMSKDLLDRLDNLVKARGFANRSQAIAEMVRNELVEHRGKKTNKKIAGTITIVYDHHKRNIQSLLTSIQHNHGEHIVATLHVHLDHHNCMEVLAVCGCADSIRKLADRLIAAKGVKHGKLTMTTTGEEFAK